ncbi:gliding motility protein GldC [Chitinophaga sp. SYP-B3965]|jgi:gliding motility-associated protein GldC|uniref:gliding motility protein GldC n=1 Tax=Chitinophaga sp. SYP-B3965 TaxID=2663120 RepID=UPI001299D7C0|nr:gliding motility protein GldC [Chitinophaga sp. SYP-B3965]MRG46848.1 gliding motility protein GldC [Chitinophaga sp. SYP-B3965]
MTKESTIQIKVALDENKVPEKIEWTASDSTADRMNKAKAMMVAFWDGADKTALRIDLWTKEMMVDEMADFFYQTMMTMADTYQRATPWADQANDLRAFATDFYKKFEEKLKNQNQ